MINYQRYDLRPFGFRLVSDERTHARNIARTSIPFGLLDQLYIVFMRFVLKLGSFVDYGNFFNQKLIFIKLDVLTVWPFPRLNYTKKIAVSIRSSQFPSQNFYGFHKILQIVRLGYKKIILQNLRV